MVAMLRCAVVCAVIGFAARAQGEPPGDSDVVALLPLDAERSLELYGQPVANQIARALIAGALQVVVVGPRMAVPERAQLIIDGTIAAGKAGAVTVALRIRGALDGVVLETVSATAPGLANIDSAAAELAARILPLVRDRLAAIRRPPAPDDRGGTAPTRRLPVVPDGSVLVAVVDARRSAPADPLRDALAAAVADGVRAQHRRPQPIEPGKLDRKLAVPSVAASGSDLALGFWILDYAPELGALPMARARVRVQITDASAVRFDRVVVTDTVLGDKGLTPPELAARVAREVLAIVRPHLRRSVPSWR